MADSTRFKPGWEWPFAIVAFFVLLALINAWVIYTSFSTAGPLVEEGAYERGIAYQQTIDKMAVPERLGWKTDFSIAAENGVSMGRLALMDRERRPITGAQVMLKGIRPNDASADFLVPLPQMAAGLYQANLPLSQSGLWYFEISVKSGSQEALLKIQRMLSVKPQG